MTQRSMGGGCHNDGYTGALQIEQGHILSSRQMRTDVVGSNELDPFHLLAKMQERQGDIDSDVDGVSPPLEVPSVVVNKKRITFPLCGRNDEDGTVAKNLVEHRVSTTRNPHVRSRATFGVKHSGFFGTVRIR